MRPSTLTDVESDSDSPGTSPAPRAGRLVDRVALLAVVLFAVVGIGTPLLGLTTFANTDLLGASSPYVSVAAAGPVTNSIANDVVASVLPSTSLFSEELRDGRLAAWNPYVAGGSPLGADAELRFPLAVDAAGLRAAGAGRAGVRQAAGDPGRGRRHVTSSCAGCGWAGPRRGSAAWPSAAAPS